MQTMMVWLWGINLWVFAQSNIGYVKIFDLDQSHLTHREIWKVVILNFELDIGVLYFRLPHYNFLSCCKSVF